jgi:hypothetical protein
MGLAKESKHMRSSSLGMGPYKQQSTLLKGSDGDKSRLRNNAQSMLDSVTKQSNNLILTGTETSKEKPRIEARTEALEQAIRESI